MITGSCLCGRVKYEARGKPLFCVVCHCRDGQGLRRRAHAGGGRAQGGFLDDRRGPRVRRARLLSALRLDAARSAAVGAGSGHALRRRPRRAVPRVRAGIRAVRRVTGGTGTRWHSAASSILSPGNEMALSATIYTSTCRLSDVDRGVYESLALVARQAPSESEEYLVTRVLAYCLEYSEGIAFSRGLAEPDEPPLAVRDLTGALQAWIEIGAPDAARLHKAAKAAPRVVVYTHKDPAQLVRCSTASASTAPRRWSSTRSTASWWRRLVGASQRRTSSPVGHRPPPLRHDRRRDAVGRSRASGACMSCDRNTSER